MGRTQMNGKAPLLRVLRETRTYVEEDPEWIESYSYRQYIHSWKIPALTFVNAALLVCDDDVTVVPVEPGREEQQQQQQQGREGCCH